MWIIRRLSTTFALSPEFYKLINKPEFVWVRYGRDYMIVKGEEVEGFEKKKVSFAGARGKKYPALQVPYGMKRGTYLGYIDKDKREMILAYAGDITRNALEILLFLYKVNIVTFKSLFYVIVDKRKRLEALRELEKKGFIEVLKWYKVNLIRITDKGRSYLNDLIDKMKLVRNILTLKGNGYEIYLRKRGNYILEVYKHGKIEESLIITSKRSAISKIVEMLEKII